MDRIIMDELIITKERIDEFRNYLRLEEKSENTIEKYMRDIKAFWQYAGTQIVTKELAIAYKENLMSNEYAVRSVNSMIASIILEYRNIEQARSSVGFYNSLIIQHQI